MSAPGKSEYPHRESRAATMLTEGLRRLATERDVSLRQTAKKLGFKQSTVLSHMANGRMPIPLDRAIELAQAVNLPVREFALAVLEQRHPKFDVGLVAGVDPIAADLEAYAGRPLNTLPAEQLRVIREAAADPNAPRRWMTLFETPVMELVRSLRPEVASNGLDGATRDRIALAITEEAKPVPHYRVRDGAPRPLRGKL